MHLQTHIDPFLHVQPAQAELVKLFAIGQFSKNYIEDNQLVIFDIKNIS